MTAIEEFCVEYAEWRDDHEAGYDGLIGVSGKLYDLLMGERLLVEDDEYPEVI